MEGQTEGRREGGRHWRNREAGRFGESKWVREREREGRGMERGWKGWG